MAEPAKASTDSTRGVRAVTDPPAPFERWEKPAGLTRRGWIILGAAIFVMQIPLLHRALRPHQPVAVSIPFQDDFSDPGTVARAYWSTGGAWRVIGGELYSPGVKDNPLWLMAQLPHDVAIDFDARAVGTDGDIKVDLFGDGLNHDSGYQLALGASGNTRVVIGRHNLDAPQLRELSDQARAKGKSSLTENGYDLGTWARVEGPRFSLQPGRSYHFHIERRGTLLTWALDGQPILSFDDPVPLAGKGHDRFGFNSWENPIFYDNLKIVPLEGGAGAQTQLLPPQLPTQPEPKPITEPFLDTFDRDELGADWNVTNPRSASLQGGVLTIVEALNQPTWLRPGLPQNASIEFDTWTEDPSGDIKVEAWGDGQSAFHGDPRAAYDATGYVFIFGGWHNTASVIARQEEHGQNRAAREDVRVEPGHHYHMRIARQGGHFDWQLDGQPFLTYDDPSPLTGAGHDHFAFSGWQTQVHFDNLKIAPL